MYYSHSSFLFFKKRFYLFIFREGEGGRKSGKHQCVAASCTPPNGDLALNPGMGPRLGIKPTTIWFAVRHSVHWATPARAHSSFRFDFMVLRADPRQHNGIDDCSSLFFHSPLWVWLTFSCTPSLVSWFLHGKKNQIYLNHLSLYYVSSLPQSLCNM